MEPALIRQKPWVVQAKVPFAVVTFRYKDYRRNGEEHLVRLLFRDPYRKRPQHSGP